MLWPLERSLGRPLMSDEDSAPSMAFGRDGVLATGGAVRLWDVASRNPVGRPLTNPSNAGWVYANAIAVSPDGKTLAIRGVDDDRDVVWLWDIVSRRRLGRPFKGLRNTGEGNSGESVASVAFSSDGDTLATAGGTAGTVRLWDVASRRPLSPALAGHN